MSAVGSIGLPRGDKTWLWILGVTALLFVAVVTASTVGPAQLPVADVVRELVGMPSGLTAIQQDVLWKIRMPRVVLGALVGAALASGGVAYQAVFRNPLADPYLLGVAAGAGLGATLVFVAPAGILGVSALPAAAFVGAVVAVVCTYGIGVAGHHDTATLVLAGVAVAAFFTAVQTYLQQTRSETLRAVYTWILGHLGTAGWTEVMLALPYVVVATGMLLLISRHLDLLQVGDEEATSLGANPARVRMFAVIAATLGTAAAVAVSGLIGFVGLVVPHLFRMLAGARHRRLLPLSMIGGAAFLVFADVVARTVVSPAELPIGVITAFVGAPFFVVVLRSRTRGAT